MRFVNPIIEVVIEEWTSEGIDLEVDIQKDLDAEPNEATVTLYNISEDTRNRIINPDKREVPIQINIAPFGSEDAVQCFLGEIISSRTYNTWPGTSTVLVCTSQNWQSRSKYIENETYEKETPVSQIVQDLIDIIDLPSQVSDLPNEKLKLGQTITGPAFLALRAFVSTFGFKAYICDGVLYISDVYSPPQGTVIEIKKTQLTSSPEPYQRKDVVDVVLQTVTETNGKGSSEKPKRRQKRKTKKEALSKNDYVTYDCIDDTVFGQSIECLSVPNVQPDMIIKIEDTPLQYRAQKITHRGNNKSGILTQIEADVFEGEDF